MHQTEAEGQKPVSGIMQLVKMQKGILSGKRHNAKRHLAKRHNANRHDAPINVKPVGGVGRTLIDRFGPGVGHLNYLAVQGVGIFECLFVPVTTNHFPGGEF